MLDLNWDDYGIRCVVSLLFFLRYCMVIKVFERVKGIEPKKLSQRNYMLLIGREICRRKRCVIKHVI